MTQAQQSQIKCFRKAFPEYSDYSDMEAVAFVRGFKSEKKKADKWIEKRIDRRFN